MKVGSIHKNSKTRYFAVGGYFCFEEDKIKIKSKYKKENLKLKKANDDKIAAENLAAAKELGKKIEESEITIAIKVGEGGKSFGSVSSKEIAEEVKSQLGYDVDKKKVQLKDAIKNVGIHEVKIKLHPKVTTTLKVNVVGK